MREKLKQLRKEKNLSQAEIAKILNVHQTAVSQWEQGRTTPDMQTLIKIADYFQVTVDYLLGQTSEKKSLTNETILNAHEEKVILAYRSKPSMQPAVDRLLDVDSEPSESTGASYIAAAGENPGGGTTHFSKEELAALHSTPDTDEDF